VGSSCDKRLSKFSSNDQDRTSNRTGEATQTDKRTAGVFLDTLSALAYKEIKKNGEFVVPVLASW